MPFQPNPPPSPGRISTASGLYRIGKRELRLDVKDRHLYPQMAASGNFTLSPSIKNIDWVATDLKENSPNWWTGKIAYVWDGKTGYKHGDVNDFPYTTVDIWLSSHQGRQYAYVTFSGKDGKRGKPIKLQYRWEHFRQVDIEFAFTEPERAITTVNTCALLERPANLRCENLSIQTVFERAGFKVTTKSLEKPVPLAGAGPDELWTDSELHDMLVAYLSQAADRQPWSIYVLFASRHKDGAHGVMFDRDVGDPRQGCAIFTKSFEDYPESAAWRKRQIFFAACHEIGHCLNLTHSWEPLAESVGWFMSSPEPKSLSFINYAETDEFFKTFEYRFSGQDAKQKRRGRDLLFIRHAPDELLQPGSKFDLLKDNRLTNLSTKPKVKLELRANRKGERPIFKYMEPVTLEMKLTNVSSRPQEIDEHLLRSADCMTVIIKKGRQSRQIFRPYARNCWRPSPTRLGTKPDDESPKRGPDHKRYESLFVSAGPGGRERGWYIADPGDYRLQVILQVNGEEVPSNELVIHVEPPSGRYKMLQKRLDQDYFCDDVGRIIALDGSRLLAERKKKILSEVIERLSDHPAAIHASVAWGIPLTRKYNRLHWDGDRSGRRKQFRIQSWPDQPQEARTRLDMALTVHKKTAIESLGHIDYKWYVDLFSDWVFEKGDVDGAVKIQDDLLKTMSARRVKGRPILDKVLQDIKQRRDGYKTERSEDTPNVGFTPDSRQTGSEARKSALPALKP